MTKFYFLLLLLVSSIYVNAQYDVVVAKDGTGNYTSIQAAINAAPTGNTVPYKIFIKKGKYREQLSVPSNKPFLEFIGEDVATTTVSYGDGGGGTTTFTISANDCMVMNLTLENTQGYISDGPQSLAIKTNNVDRIVFKNCRFISGQDTVYTSGSGKRIYFKNCYIDGNTDFIYGAAIALFDSCIIFPRDRVDGASGGYVTAANTPNGQTYGLVFRDCVIPNNRGITNYTLGRPWQNDAGSSSNPAYNKTVFLNTTMSRSITAVGWSAWDAGTTTSTITYAEYRSRKFDSALVDVSQRISWSQQLTASQAIAYYINSNLFGTWDPYAVWTDLSVVTQPVIALANLRALRSSSGTTIPFNISWPINNVKYELLRSTDSITFSKVNEFTIANDTTAAYYFTDMLPPTGTTYFYKVVASKTGYTTYTTDTVVKINTSIPLNGDYKTIASGGFSNNVSAVSAISGGVVTSVTITSSPSGYTTAPTVTFTAAPAGGTTATGTAILSGGKVTGVTLTNAGSGYTSAPTATFSTTSVGAASIWQKYTTSTSTWDAVTLGTAPSNSNITISSGNTIAVNSLFGITTLNIENGAVLQSDGQSRNIRMNGDIINNGTFGGSSSSGGKLTMEMNTTNGTFNIGGTGVFSFATFRPLTAVQTSTYNISANMTLTGGLQGWYASSSATDQGNNNITINIATGNTITASFLHSSSSTNTTTTFGNYTYNINGILDLSNSTTLTGLIPHATASTKSITVNVNGILRLGTQFRMISTSPTSTEGKVNVNIGDEGLIDATKSTTLFAVSPSYFVTTGSGALKRTVATTATMYPIGTSVTSYTPVVITNAGISDDYSVSVKNSFDNSVSDPTKVVNKQWTILEDNDGGSNLTLAFSWTIADQAVAFNPSSSVSVIYFNGTSWVEIPAIVTGAGTTVSPYTATITGITSVGKFSIQNTQSLPLLLKSFSAKKIQNGIAVNWETLNEVNVKVYEIETSIHGNDFVKKGFVYAQNLNSNKYQFIDASIAFSEQYYRLKMIDNDGSFKYSTIIKIGLNSKQNKIQIDGNPIYHGVLKLKMTDVEDKELLLEIYSANGQKVWTQKVSTSIQYQSLALPSYLQGNYFVLLRGYNIIFSDKIVLVN